MANWRKIIGTGIDVGAATLGIGLVGQGASYALTGKSLGENITGESAAPKLNKNLFGGSTDAANLTNYQKNMGLSQLQRAGQIEQELDAMGRPEMQAQLQRQQEIADLARGYAREGMPEAQRQMASDDIARMQSQSLSAMSNLGGGLRGLGQTGASTAQQYRQLAAQDAAIAQQNQGQLLGSLGALGAAEGTAEQFNVIQPYTEKQAELQALLGSGQQNQYNALLAQQQQQMADRQLVMDGLGIATQVGGVVAASDARLKENVSKVGVSDSGIPIYTWNYNWDTPDKKHKGVMAQDLIKQGRNDAVVNVGGYYAVDYSKIDVDFQKV